MGVFSLLLFFCFPALTPVYAQIVLSEIMFNPAGNERYNEYIELYNNQADDTIDISGWLISDGQKFNILTGVTETRLPPRHYAVIFVPNYYDNSLVYEDRMPAGSLHLTIDRASFGAYGLSNSEGETVSIYTPDTVLVSSWTYSVPNADGISEEKKVIEFPDCAENWGDSRLVGGTPGCINSNTPLSCDLALVDCEVVLTPETPTKNDSVGIIVRVTNEGRLAIENFYLDIKSGETIRTHHVILDSFGWNDAKNDSLFRDIAIRADPGDVVINEILYYTEKSDQEWLELYNPSSVPIDLGQWQIRDRGKYVFLTGESFFIGARCYAVISHQSLQLSDVSSNLICPLLPEFNNGSDEIVLLDATSAVIDSLHYSSAGIDIQRFVSLERLRFEDPAYEQSNWALCRENTGSTPGRLNSTSPRTYDLELKNIELSQKYPFQDESCGLYAVVFNSGRTSMDDIRIRFFAALHSIDSLQPIGDEIFIRHLSPRSQHTVFTEWKRLPPGRHTVCAVSSHKMDLVAQNDSVYTTCTVSYPAGVVVCNEIMYRPAQGLCEWIELVNPQSFPVNIAEWIFSDGDTSCGYRLCDSTLFIEPGRFLVICKDSSMYEPEVDFPYIIDSRFPALSNQDDSLFVYDGNGRLIDCIHYSSGWGGKIGRTLERVNPFTSSSVSTNWSTCVHSLGHTLGKPNSIHAEILPVDVSLSVSPNPFSPDFDGFEDMLVITFQLPVETAAVNLKIFDSKGRMVRFLRNNEPSGSRATLFWDGLDDSGQRCRMGIYILFLQALDVMRCEIHRGWKTVVLAGRL